MSMRSGALLIAGAALLGIAGSARASIPSSIGDFVWEDLDADGVQDVGEPGVPGVRVFLDGMNFDDEVVHLETTTDADGEYLFADIVGGTFTVTFELPGGFAFTTQDQGGDDATDSDANVTTGQTVATDLEAGEDDLTWDAGLVRVAQDPGLRLVKSATPNPVAAGQPVTYSYEVTNTGAVTLTDVTITDDHGTPADTSDDFVAGTAATLAPGEVRTFTVTLFPTVTMCMTIDGTTEEVGTLEIETLPGGDVKVRYLQSRNVVDNTYGVNSVGYPKHHNFGDLLGSDKAQFRFRDGAGSVVLEFIADYISSSSAYPSGYGTLGVAGGDGKMVVGSSANVVSVETSITESLNQSPAFYGFTTDSPAEPNAAWDYVDSYTVVVKGSLFTANGFGGVEIPGVHNSPSKKGFNLFTPEPCDSEVTNVATARGSYVASGTTQSIEATDSETVQVGTGGGGSGTADVDAGALQFDGKKALLTLTNNGTGTATIQTLNLTWPSGNKKLNKIRVGGATVFNKKTAPTSVTVTQWKGKLTDRQIPAGGSVTLRFEFEKNAGTSASAYGLSIDFGGGPVTLLP